MLTLGGIGACFDPGVRHVPIPSGGAPASPLFGIPLSTPIRFDTDRQNLL